MPDDSVLLSEEISAGHPVPRHGVGSRATYIRSAQQLYSEENDA